MTVAPAYPAVMPAAPATPAEKAPAPKTNKEGEVSASPARVVVELPADARLYIDDQPMKASSERRSFNTPTLQPGQAYFYEVRAEVVRDGKTYSETKRVIVRSGQTARTSFPDLTTAGTTPASKPVAAAR